MNKLSWFPFSQRLIEFAPSPQAEAGVRGSVTIYGDTYEAVAYSENDAVIAEAIFTNLDEAKSFVEKLVNGSAGTPRPTFPPKKGDVWAWDGTFRDTETRDAPELVTFTGTVDMHGHFECTHPGLVSGTWAKEAFFDGRLIPVRCG
jgi:hypothetical protein